LWRHLAFAAALFDLALFGIVTSHPAIAGDSFSWPPITSQTRPWVWWWWHGSAVDETNIAHELQRFHEAGVGGVQITSIYGVKGAEGREIAYLSPRWLTMMGYTVDEAHRLGMGVDMSLGSGWCFGGPTVNNQDANASVVVKTYGLSVGERITEKFDRKTTQALVAFSPEGKIIELTDTIDDNGNVTFSPPGNFMATTTNSAPPKTWTVFAISQKPSGQKVKRPAIGGEGWMLNPAYPQAMRDWLRWFDQALTNYSGSKPEAIFQDSYEYRTDWAPDFFTQFEKRRGYKLQEELPALFADTSLITDADARALALDRSARVKYDYRRTLSEIMAEESEPAWITWAHKNGFSAIYQAHGSPANWLDLYGDADVPETEMFHNDRNILISKFASSAAHTQGHSLTGAETGTWLKEHFTETLADLKYLADDMFLAGVNHIYYHGACYSPDNVPWPGWLFYASTEMNPRNPVWHDVGTLNGYIARCQSILQEGKPDNDILLYWPIADYWSDPKGFVQPMSVSKTEWFENQPIGKTAHELWDAGYSFDYVSDAQVLKAKVVDGKIRMPGGDYKVIVVPRCQHMPLETFRQMLALANAGATVIFDGRPPSDIPGFDQSRRPKFENELTKFWPFLNNGDQIFKEGSGTIGCGNLWQVLPTVVAREPAVLYDLSFIRRTFGGGWNYFVANRSTSQCDRWVSLACPANFVMILDPMTGRSGIAAQNKEGQVHLQLAPGQSLILRAFANKTGTGPAWVYWKTNNRPFKVSGEWNIKFLSGGPALPADFQTAKLASWTTFPDTTCQTFAGTALYTTIFDAPGSAGKTFELNLGDVRQSARVRVNGKDYGTLIAPPFRVTLDGLKPTGNLLEVEVTSVAANRIRDLDRRGVNWKIFKDINIVDVDYHPFNAANWPLTDCGLLGPVKLTQITPK